MGNAAGFGALELLPPIRCETQSTAKLSDFPLIWMGPVHSVWKQSTPLNVSEPLNFLSKQIGTNALPQHNIINTCHKSSHNWNIDITFAMQCYTVHPFLVHPVENGLFSICANIFRPIVVSNWTNFNFSSETNKQTMIKTILDNFVRWEKIAYSPYIVESCMHASTDRPHCV